MTHPTAFNVDRFLDGRRIGAYHILIIMLLVLTMLVDGYDLFVVGLVLPAISKAWHVAPAALTGVFVAQQAGLLAGVTITGPFADRHGRKLTLILCLVGFALCTLAIAQTRTPIELTAVRFVSAIFFSGVLPNCVTLASEIAPKRLRATIIGIVFCGYTGGSFVGATVLAFVIGPFGWQGAFYVGALLPLLLLPLLILFLPESIRFRASRDPADPRIARALRRIDPQLDLDGYQRFELDAAPAAKGARWPVRALFSDGLLRMTLLVWTAYFMAFMLNQFLHNWNSTILNQVAGLPFGHIALILSVSTAAGICGTASVGLVMDRLGAARTLFQFYVGAAGLLVLLAFVDLGSTPALILFALLSYAINCGQAGLNAQAVMIYPAHMRVTGIAWGSGIGRIGGMLGPLMGGLLLSGTPTATAFYLVAAVPELLAGIALFFIGWAARQRQPQDDEAAAAAVAAGASRIAKQRMA